MERTEIAALYQEIIAEVAACSSPLPNGQDSRCYDEYSLDWYIECGSRVAALPPGRALDVGCRFGTNSIFLRRLGWRVTALDIRCDLPEMLRQQYGVLFRPIDLDNPQSYPGGIPPGFELIYMTEVLEHLNFSPAPALSWLRRLLHPRGALILTTPDATRYPECPDIPTRRDCHWSQIPPWEPGRPREHERHSKQYTRDELTDMLCALGFVVPDGITVIHAQGAHLLAVAYRACIR